LQAEKWFFSFQKAHKTKNELLENNNNNNNNDHFRFSQVQKNEHFLIFKKSCFSFASSKDQKMNKSSQNQKMNSSKERKKTKKSSIF
jgi:hypothetical protein